MPTDPMLSILSTDSKGEALIDKALVNFRKRHWWHIEDVDSTSKTVDDNTELLNCKADTDNVAVTLPAASGVAGQAVIVYAASIGSGYTVTVTVGSGDTFTGGPSGGSPITLTLDQFIYIISDGTDSWIVLHDGTA